MTPNEYEQRFLSPPARPAEAGEVCSVHGWVGDAEYVRGKHADCAAQPAQPAQAAQPEAKV